MFVVPMQLKWVTVSKSSSHENVFLITHSCSQFFEIRTDNSKLYNIFNKLGYVSAFTKLLYKAFCSKTTNSLSQYIVQ